MPYQVEETGELTRRASVQVPADEYQKVVDKELRKLSGRVNIRGFRKGKVPMSVMRKRYGEAVEQDVMESVIRRYLNELLEEEGSNVIHLGEAEVDFEASDEDGFEFSVEFEVRPDLDPVGYLGLEIEKPVVEVTTEELEEQLEGLREHYAAYEPIEHRDTVSEGDTVFFDFRAVNPDDDPGLEEFEGEDAQITVGEGEALPGIEEAVTGADFHSTVVATVEPPETFGIEELRGKSFDVEVQINSVKRRVLPELDDDFAVDTGEAETMLELRQKVREEIAGQKEHHAHHLAESNLIEQLLEDHDFELPPKFLEQQVNQRLRQRLQQMLQQGFDPQSEDFDVDSFRDELESDTVEQIRSEFLLSAIADKEAVSVEEEDIDAYFEHRAMHMGVPADQLEQYVRQDDDQFRQAVASARLEKVVNRLLEEATFKEVEWPTPEPDESEQSGEAETSEQTEEPAAETPADAAAPEEGEAGGDAAEQPHD